MAHPDGVGPEPPGLAVAESAAVLNVEQDRAAAAPWAGQSADRQAAAGRQTALALWERPVLASAAEESAAMESASPEQNWPADRLGQLCVLEPEVGAALQVLEEHQGTPTRPELAQEAAEHPVTAQEVPRVEVAWR